MTDFVVLLRGVNVGKARRVPMADFKALLLGMGCTRATTLLNSGNAVVRSPLKRSAALASAVQAAITAHFGFSVPGVVKSAAEWSAIVQANTLAAGVADPSRLLVVLSQDTQGLAALQPLHALLLPGEQLLLQPQAAYLHCAGGILQSRAGEALLGRLGQGITTRNWATVLKLQALLATDDSQRPQNVR
jgi:uncharacterized protein (DUF1697 family)